MTCRNHGRVIVLVLPALILALLVIPVLMAGAGISGAANVPGSGRFCFGSTALPFCSDQHARDVSASNVTRWMQEHAGQEVTAGEYLDITNPGYLSSRPQEVRDAYHRMKIRVPDFSNPDPGNNARLSGGPQFGERSVAIAVFGYREVPGDSQEVFLQNYTGQCILNESMIARSNGLAGREIPVGTYLETVCPDFFLGLTESRKEVLNNQSLMISEIPGRGNVSSFVPPRSLSISRMEPVPGWVSLHIPEDGFLNFNANRTWEGS